MPRTDMDIAAQKAFRERLTTILQANPRHWMSELLLDPGTGRLWRAAGREDRVFSLPTVDAGHMHAGMGDQAQFAVEFSLQNRASYVAENTLVYYTREAVWVDVGDARVPMMKTDLEALERLGLAPAGTVAAAPAATGWGPQDLLTPERYAALQARLPGTQGERFLSLQRQVGDPALGNPPDQSFVDDALAAREASSTPEARAALALANSAAEDAASAARGSATEVELAKARAAMRASSGGFVSVGGLLFGLIILGSAVYVYNHAADKVTAITNFAVETLAGLAEIEVAEAIGKGLGWNAGLAGLVVTVLGIPTDSPTSEWTQRVVRTDDFLDSAGFVRQYYTDSEYQLLRNQAYELLFQTTPLVIAPTGTTGQRDDFTTAYVDEHGRINPSNVTTPAGAGYDDSRGAIHGANFNLADSSHVHQPHPGVGLVSYDSSTQPHDDSLAATPAPAHEPPHGAGRGDVITPAPSAAPSSTANGHASTPFPYDSGTPMDHENGVPAGPPHGSPDNVPRADSATPAQPHDAGVATPLDQGRPDHQNTSARAQPHDPGVATPPDQGRPDHQNGSAPAQPHDPGAAPPRDDAKPDHVNVAAPPQRHDSPKPSHDGSATAPPPHASSAPAHSAHAGKPHHDVNTAPHAGPDTDAPSQPSAAVPDLVRASPEEARHYTVEGVKAPDAYNGRPGNETAWLIFKDGVLIGRVTDSPQKPELNIFHDGDKIQIQVVVPGGGKLEPGGPSQIEWGIWNPGPAPTNHAANDSQLALDHHSAGIPTGYGTGDAVTTNAANPSTPTVRYDSSQPAHDSDATPPGQDVSSAQAGGASAPVYDSAQPVHVDAASPDTNQPGHDANTPAYDSANQPGHDANTPVHDPANQPGHDANTPARDSANQPGHDANTPAYDSANQPGHDANTPAHDSANQPGHDANTPAHDSANQPGHDDGSATGAAATSASAAMHDVSFGPGS
jgi:hypothetical protein